jgi:uncharacterized protein YjbJ (UPF0337 family)
LPFYSNYFLFRHFFPEYRPLQKPPSLRHTSCKGKVVASLWCLTKSETTKTQKAFMTTLKVKGNWNIMMGKLKQKFAQLTHDDLQFMEGKESELIGRIQKRTGQTREKVRQTVKECWECKHHGAAYRNS